MIVVGFAAGQLSGWPMRVTAMVAPCMQVDIATMRPQTHTLVPDVALSLGWAMV